MILSYKDFFFIFATLFFSCSFYHFIIQITEIEKEKIALISKLSHNIKKINLITKYFNLIMKIPIKSNNQSLLYGILFNNGLKIIVIHKINFSEKKYASASYITCITLNSSIINKKELDDIINYHSYRRMYKENKAIENKIKNSDILYDTVFQKDKLLNLDFLINISDNDYHLLLNELKNAILSFTTC